MAIIRRDPMRAPIVVAAFLFGLGPAHALAACEAPPYHQFDFWIGSWRVTDAHGKLRGHDFVSRRLQGCAIYEEYHDANDPSVGIGMTTYDAGRRRWHQDFMDDTGFFLMLDGSFHNGAMTLEGTDYPNGKPQLNRGTWTRRGDVVEELWQVSVDGGKTWRTKFDGFFHRL